MEQQVNKNEIKEERKVMAENMRLKKQIKQLEEENLRLKTFIGGIRE